VTFAILAMNGTSYLLDSLLEGPRMGQLEKRKKVFYHLGTIGFAFIIIVLLSWLGTYIVS